MIQVISTNCTSKEFWETHFSNTRIQMSETIDHTMTQMKSRHSVFLIDNYFQKAHNIEWFLNELRKLQVTGKAVKVYCISPSFTDKMRSDLGEIEIVESQLSSSIIHEIQSLFSLSAINQKL